VETEGLSDSPEIGGALDLRVFVSLGDLAPEDVDVQVVHGRVKGEDQLVDTATSSLGVGESYEGGRHRFDGHLQLARAGSFGYTVRILPRNAALASPAELGLVVQA
jgi:starch phosphorylase